MSRLSKLDVEHAVSRLARELGTTLKLAMNSPGDRHGTRYRVHLQGGTPDSLGTQIFAECGAKAATEGLWHMIYGAQLYKRLNTVPAHAVDAVQDIEAQ